MFAKKYFLLFQHCKIYRKKFFLVCSSFTERVNFQVTYENAKILTDSNSESLMDTKSSWHSVFCSNHFSAYNCLFWWDNIRNMSSVIHNCNSRSREQKLLSYYIIIHIIILSNYCHQRDPLIVFSGLSLLYFKDLWINYNHKITVPTHNALRYAQISI